MITKATSCTLVLVLSLCCSCSKKWYVNDQGVTGDIFTCIPGDNTKGTSSKKKPFAIVNVTVEHTRFSTNKKGTIKSSV